jgi:hypothetical protein
MITLLLQLLIVAIVVGLVIWLVEQIPGVQPFANIIRVVAICIFVIYLIYILMGFVGGFHPVPGLR